MAYDRFLIAPIKTGLITEIPAWQIPEDAYARLNNAYIYKGVIRKRFGSQLMGTAQSPLTSRLRINVGTTNAGTGNLTVTVPGARFEVGQMFSIGTEIYTVNTTGTPGVMLKDSGGATTHTFDTTSGEVVFVAAALNTDAFYYPADPVMGLTHYEANKVESNVVYAFDRQFIYKYTSCAWGRDGTVVLKGSDSQFVWAANWTGIDLDDIALFMTNFNATIGAPVPANDDSMYALKNGTWESFKPVYNVVGNVPKGYVNSAKIIIPFKNRLLLLNTIEYDVDGNSNQEHVNRVRFSHDGVPFPAEGPDNTAADVSKAWLGPNETWTVGGTAVVASGADYLDAPTEEEITSAEFIKDRLIVYFESSTWELAYTGNQVQPFAWQKINTELGTLALKSPVPFDKAVLTVGRTGVHGCTGANVAKVNEKIGDFTYDIRISDEGPKRIAGIRDYFIDTVLWSYPSVDANVNSQIFPDKVLMYNYLDDSWGTADDCITAFGYYDEQTCVAAQTPYRQVLGGNQQGYVFICDSEFITNAAVMQVSGVVDLGGGIVGLVIINHTLNDGDFIRLTGLEGIVINELINYEVTIIDEDTISIAATFTGTYTGAGRVARISRIDILSKQWNFYIGQGKNFYLAKIDFAVTATDSGEITIDYFPSATSLSMIDSGVATGSILGNNNLETSPYALYPLEQEQTRLWHSVYFQTEGECVQIRIYLDDVQMASQLISGSDFRLEGLIVSARQTSERLQ